MKRSLLLFLILMLTSAQVKWEKFMCCGGTGGGFTPSCTASTNLINAMDGGENKSAVDTAICGIATDLGSTTLVPLDGLYVFAVNGTATGNMIINWAHPGTNNLTGHSAVNCTFTANVGITGDASTCYFDSGYVPTALTGNMTLPSASIGVCVLNSRTVDQTYDELGAEDVAASTFISMQPKTSGGNFYAINDVTFPSFTTANAQGSWIGVRVLSTNTHLYLNGSEVAGSPFTAGQIALPDRSITIMAVNESSPTLFSGDQLAYAFFGGGLTATQAANIRTRLQTYVAAVGGSGC